MPEPDTSTDRETGNLERSKHEVLTAARPLPDDDDSVIEDLTDDEDRLFVDAILNA